MALADAPDVVPEAVALLGGRAQGEISTSQLEVGERRPDDAGRRAARGRRAAPRRRRRGAAARLPHPADRHPPVRHLARPDAARPTRATTSSRSASACWRCSSSSPACTSTSSSPTATSRCRCSTACGRTCRCCWRCRAARRSGRAATPPTQLAHAALRPLPGHRLAGAAAATGRRTTALVADLVTSGVVRDASHLYWDARLSTRFPTIEVRIADVCPHLDDVVLQAGLARSLVRTAARAAVTGDAVPRSRGPSWSGRRAGARPGPGSTDELLDLARRRAPAGRRRRPRPARPAARRPRGGGRVGRGARPGRAGPRARHERRRAAPDLRPHRRPRRRSCAATVEAAVPA